MLITNLEFSRHQLDQAHFVNPEFIGLFQDLDVGDDAPCLGRKTDLKRHIAQGRVELVEKRVSGGSLVMQETQTARF